MPTVMIVGANRGLGLEYARQYSQAGWRVIATSRSLERAEGLRVLGVEVHRLDVGDFAAVEALGAELADERLDLLISNAGVMPAESRDMRPDQVARNAESWLDMFRVNAMAPLALAGAFAEQLRRGDRRKLIAMSSVLGSIGSNTREPRINRYAYRATKAALNAVWRNLAMENPDLIVTMLHPGWVRTDMGGAGGGLSPSESVAGLRAVIDGLGPADSGGFFDYSGKTIPW